MFRQYRVSKSRRLIKSISYVVMFTMLCQIAMVPEALAREIAESEQTRLELENARQERLGLSYSSDPGEQDRSIRRAAHQIASEIKKPGQGLRGGQLSGDIDALIDHISSRQSTERFQLSQVRAKLGKRGFPAVIMQRLTEYENSLEQQTNQRLQALRRARLTSTGPGSQSAAKNIQELFQVQVDVRPDPHHLPHVRHTERRKPIGAAPVFEYPWKLADLNSMDAIGDIFGSLDGLGVSGMHTDDDLAVSAPEIEFEEAFLDGPSDCLDGSDPVRCLVESMNADPIRIFEHVRNEYAYEFYFGSMKGTRRVLNEKRANDLDLASLLISMLRSSGVPSRYVFGTIEMDVDDAIAWAGVRDEGEFVQLMIDSGIPVEYDQQAHVIRKDHVWVRAYMDLYPYRSGSGEQDTWVDLDPSFKQHSFSGEDIGNLFNLSISAMLSNSRIGAEIQGEFSYPKWVKGLDRAPSVSKYRSLAEPLRDYLVDHQLTAEDIFWQRHVTEQQFGVAPITDLYRIHDTGVSTQSVPPVLKHRVEIRVEDPQTYPAGQDTWLQYEADLAVVSEAQISLHYVADDPSLSLLSDPNGFGGNTTLLRMQPQLEFDGIIVAQVPDLDLLAIPGEVQRLVVKFRGPGEQDGIDSGLNVPPIVDQVMVGGVHSLVMNTGTVTAEDLDSAASRLDSVVFDDNDLFQTTGLPTTIGRVTDSIGRLYFHQMDRYNQMIAGSLGVVITRHPSIARVSWELDVPDPQLPNNATGGDVTVRVLRDAHVVAMGAGSPADSGNMNPDDQFVLTSALTSNAVEASALKQVLGEYRNLDPTADLLGDHASVVRLIAQIMEEGRNPLNDTSEWHIHTASGDYYAPGDFETRYGVPYPVASYLSSLTGSHYELVFSKGAFSLETSAAVSGERKWHAVIQRHAVTNAVAFHLIDETGVFFSSGRFVVRGEEGSVAPSLYELLQYNTENHELYSNLVEAAQVGVSHGEDAATNAALWFLPAVSYVNDLYRPYIERLSSDITQVNDLCDPVITPLAAILVSSPIDRATEEPAILNLLASSLNDENPHWLRAVVPGVDDDADQLHISAEVTRNADWTLTIFNNAGESKGEITGNSTSLSETITAGSTGPNTMNLDSGSYSYEITATHPVDQTIAAVPIQGQFQVDLDHPVGTISSAVAIGDEPSATYGPGLLDVYGFADDAQSFSTYSIFVYDQIAHTGQIPVADTGDTNAHLKLATIDTTAFSLGAGESTADLRLEVRDTAGNISISTLDNVNVLNPRGPDYENPVVALDKLKLYANGTEIADGSLASDGPLTLEFLATDDWIALDQDGVITSIEILLNGQEVLWSTSFSSTNGVSKYDRTNQNTDPMHTDDDPVVLQLNGSDLYPEMLVNRNGGDAHTITVIATDASGNQGSESTTFQTDEDFTQLALTPSTATLSQPTLRLTGMANLPNWEIEWVGDSISGTLNPNLTRGVGSIDELVDTPALNGGNGLPDGAYTLNFKDLDSAGAIVASIPFTVDMERYPVAELSSLADITATNQLEEVPGVTTVRDGILSIRGRAYDAAATLGDTSVISMSLSLTEMRSDSNGAAIGTPIYFEQPDEGGLWLPTGTQPGITLTSPGLGSTGPIELARLDLSTLPDGMYNVNLTVVSGTDTNPPTAVDSRPISITSPLKVGQFKFSQQDVSVPVQGLPLSLVRTYDSQRAATDSPFGKGWQFSLYDMDIQVDEVRVPANGYFQEQLEDHVTCRDVTNGIFNRNLSLTLPDGRRVTFPMRLNRTSIAGEFRPYYERPPGVRADLTVIAGPGQILKLTSQPTLHWASEGYSVPDIFFDFAGWDLKLDDGTEFKIRRPQLATNLNYNLGNSGVGDGSVTALYGKPYISSIKLASGETLKFRYTIEDGKVLDAFKYIATIESIPADATSGDADSRSLAFRYEDNHIDAVMIGSGVNGQPSYMYKYDGDDRLIEVHRVHTADIDNPAGADDNVYEIGDITRGDITKFTYEPDQTDGIIASIEDPRGLSPVVTEYYDNGRVKQITDAYGQTTRFEYDLENNTQTVYNDAEGTSVFYEYDDLGNVLEETYSDGKQIVREYDDTLLISEHDLSRGNPTTYDYDSKDQIIRTQDALGNVTIRDITYYSGTPTSIITTVVSNDPSVDDITTEQHFDLAGNLTRTVSGGTETVNEYDANRITETFVTDIDDAGAPNGLRLQTSYEYDGGKLTKVTQHNDDDPGVGTADDVVQSFVYDSFDNQILSYTERDAKFVGTRTVYDNVQRAVETWQYDDSIAPSATDDPNIHNGYTKLSSTYYNGVDQVVMTIDHRADVSSTTRYDRRGNVIETAQWPIDIEEELSGTADAAVDWFSEVVSEPTSFPFTVNTANAPVVSRTAYNHAGQAMVETDQFKAPAFPALPAGDIFGTVTKYGSGGSTLSTYRVDGARVSVEFITDSNGQGIATTLPAGPSPNEYDLGTTVDGSQSDTFYDEQGRVEYTISGTTNNKLRTEYGYDDNDRQKSVSLLSVANTSLNYVSNYTYDAAGRRDTAEDPSGNITRYRYDDLGRLTHTIANDPVHGEVETRTVYDALGRRSRTIDQLGQERAFSYDESNRLRSVTLPEVIDPGADPILTSDDAPVSPSYSYHYDTNGNLETITDPNASVTSLAYDYLGRRTSRTLPGVQSDANGLPSTGDRTENWYYYDTDTTTAGEWPSQLRAHQDFNGNVTSYTYDDEGRLDTRAHYAAADSPDPLNLGSLNPEIAYEYTFDEFGRQYEVFTYLGHLPDANPDRTTTYNYDPDGRLGSIDTPTGTVSYTYHGNGALKSINVGIDATAYSYDPFGRLKTVTRKVDGVVTGVWEYTYDAVGNRKSLKRPGGAYTYYTYDSLHRLTQLTNFQDDSMSAVLSQYTYTLRADGRRASVLDVRKEESGFSAAKVDYTYDALNRLVSEAWVNGSSLDPMYADRTGETYSSTISYTYDAAGNRVLKVVDGPADSHVKYEYQNGTDTGSDRLWKETHYSGLPGAGAQTEVIDYRWDSNGFLIHKYSSTNDDEDYTPNAEGRLATHTKAGVTSTFTYDHSGERIKTVIGLQTIDDLVTRNNPTGYSQVLTRTDSGGQDFYNIIGDDILAQEVGVLNHLLYDGHGSTRLLYTSSIQERYDYDAYGNAIGFDQNFAGTQYLYTGEQADLALGDSYYLRARFYMPGPAMFTSFDPYFGDTGEPQSLHKYAYVHGDPVNAWDPSGMSLVLVFSIGSTIRSSISSAYSLFTVYQPVLALAFAFAVQFKLVSTQLGMIRQLERTKYILSRLGHTERIRDTIVFINETIAELERRIQVGVTKAAATPLIGLFPVLSTLLMTYHLFYLVLTLYTTQILYERVFFELDNLRHGFRVASTETTTRDYASVVVDFVSGELSPTRILESTNDVMDIAKDIRGGQVDPSTAAKLRAACENFYNETNGLYDTGTISFKFLDFIYEKEY